MDTTDSPEDRGGGFQRAVLIGLNRLDGKHVYAGTANRNKVAKARRRSKLARISRRNNRRRS